MLGLTIFLAKLYFCIHSLVSTKVLVILGSTLFVNLIPKSFPLTMFSCVWAHHLMCPTVWFILLLTVAGCLTFLSTLLSLPLVALIVKTIHWLTTLFVRPTVSSTLLLSTLLVVFVVSFINLIIFIITLVVPLNLASVFVLFLTRFYNMIIKLCIYYLPYLSHSHTHHIYLTKFHE
jgi:hypothetical protein